MPPGSSSATAAGAIPPSAAGLRAGAGQAAGAALHPASKGLGELGLATGRAALIDALVRGALRGVAPGADELQRQALHNRLTSWALRVLGSHLSSGGGGGASLGDAASVVHAMKLLLRQQQRDGDAST